MFGRRAVNISLFGEKKPIFTYHFVKRWCLRYRGIPQEFISEFLNIHHYSVYCEIYKALEQATPYALSKDEKDRIKKKYGNGNYAAIYKNYIFIIKYVDDKFLIKTILYK